MTEKFTQKKLLIASGNKSKVAEIQKFLKDFDVQLIPATDFNLKEPEENGSDFIENASIKAKYYGDSTNMPALADDSGLCVNALNGMPGIYSARWAGKEKNFAVVITKKQCLYALLLYTGRRQEKSKQRKEQ